LITEKPACGPRKLGGRANDHYGFVIEKRTIGVREILPVRACDDGNALSHSFDRVLPPAVDERATDECHRRKRIQ
jgi:hypothetical protein